MLRKAFSLFACDPEISYTFLLALLHADPQLRLAQRGITLSRSALQRRLASGVKISSTSSPCSRT